MPKAVGARTRAQEWREIDDDEVQYELSYESFEEADLIDGTLILERADGVKFRISGRAMQTTGSLLFERRDPMPRERKQKEDVQEANGRADEAARDR